MNPIVEITLYLSLSMGALLLTVASANQIFRKEAPTSFLFVGLALITLPLATKIKVGPDGAEFEIRQEIAAVEAKVQAIAEAETSGRSIENPIASKQLALVMYNDRSIADKNEVLDTLKQLGYLASSVATDYSELGAERDNYQAGQVYIKYRAGLKKEASRIKKSLEKISGIERITTKEVKSFRTGDVQIALF